MPSTAFNDDDYDEFEYEIILTKRASEFSGQLGLANCLENFTKLFLHVCKIIVMWLRHIKSKSLPLRLTR
jgi:hypothetical protein